jgi:hypothetical protein
MNKAFTQDLPSDIPFIPRNNKNAFEVDKRNLAALLAYFAQTCQIQAGQLKCTGCQGHSSAHMNECVYVSKSNKKIFKECIPCILFDRTCSHSNGATPIVPPPQQPAPQPATTSTSTNINAKSGDNEDDERKLNPMSSSCNAC